jgi:tetratricopeptide (TPR) repeat protein
LATPSANENISEPSRVFVLDQRAMATLARATAVAIAWLLILPDSISVLPTSPDVTTWFLRLLGLWISALVLWYVGFLAILNIVRLVGEGISTSEAGLKLWRFAKPIPWSQIEAVEIEPQEAFSKLFSLKPVATRLILFERPKKTYKLFAGRLVAHNIPSFLFSKEQFDLLSDTICRNAMQTMPSAKNVLLVPATSLKKLRLVHKMMAGQRLLLTMLVAFGLLSLLGRKAIVNYSYNYGLTCLSQNRYVEAKKRIELALSLDPVFAPGWYELARTEYFLGDSTSAEKHWRKALLYKPDYVEAKCSLAHILIQGRKFNQARDYLDSALNLAPLNAHALLKRADLNMHIGRYRDGMSDARASLAQNDGGAALRYSATCLLAEGKLRLGDPVAAEAILARLGSLDFHAFRQGEDVNYRIVLESQCSLARHDDKEAVRLAQLAFKNAPDSKDALFNLLDILSTLDKDTDLQSLLKTAEAKYPDDQRTSLLLCKSLIRQQKTEAAEAILEKFKAQDLDSLLKAAALSVQLDKPDQAINFAGQALQIEPQDKQAQRIFEKTPPFPAGQRMSSAG